MRQFVTFFSKGLDAPVDGVRVVQMNKATAQQPPTSATVDAWLVRITRGSIQFAPHVVVGVLLVIAVSWYYASGLAIRGDFVELLPTDSPTAHRFRSALSRKKGNASTLLVIVESPDPAANRRLIDTLEQRVRALPAGLTSSVERGPGDVRTFFEKYKWLLVPIGDLERAECELFREKSRHQPGYLDLEECPSAASGRTHEPNAEPREERGLRALDAELRARVREVDRFPDGYFRTRAGDLFALVIHSPTAGMGEFDADRLLESVQAVVSTVRPADYHSRAKIGLAGDIPNAVAERAALVQDVTVVSLCAVVLICSAIALHFRSAFALVIIGVCVSAGCGLAAAIAMAVYGKLNAATSFLGAIIFGNGINYSVVYLARYQEMRRSGLAVDTSLVRAAVDCRRGTWLAALAASAAYAALLITSFRGFREFGLIGGAGMVLCWASTFIALPAMVSAFERRFPGRAGSAASRARVDSERDIASILARSIVRHPAAIVIAAMVVTVLTVVPIPAYLANPWEYNFSNLKSRTSRDTGAGHWSQKANRIFQSRGAPMLVLANDPSETTDLADALLERDERFHGGHFIERIETIDDYLGGGPSVATRKLELLGQIREHIDWLAPRVTEEDRRIAVAWRPPEDLRAPKISELPDVLVSQFEETNGTVGTPLYVRLNRSISQSNGENLLAISDILEGVQTSDGVVPDNASRATVFADMIRSLERDSPRATVASLLAVIAVSLLVTRRAVPAIAVLGSLVAGVAWTVGIAAQLGVHLNFLNFVALPLTFGIGVEYAINVYERVRVSGDIGAGVRSAGGAVSLCSLTTIIGYASLLFADNRALQSLGKYAVAGELACLATAVLVLPAALSLFGARAPRQAPAK